MNHRLSPLSTRKKSPPYLLLAASGLACVVIAAAVVQGDVARKADSPGVAQLKTTGAAFSQVAKQASPAVVFVKVKKNLPMVANSPFGNGQSPMQDEMLRRFFGDQTPNFKSPQPPRQSEGQGSGFVISKDGYILTNAHVVKGADEVEVTLSDGRELSATIVGADPRSDVAVIKIAAKNLPMLAMGDSDRLEVGEWVLAVGSPFGLPGTVTSGIVSAKGRNSVGITDYENFIQTDAAINPGNSGGPLVNLDGEAIGINTAIFSRSGGYMGIGFAIPINMAKEICDQLIADGSVTRGYLGVAIQPLTPALSRTFGLGDAKGVLISDVSEDSPAAAAGLKAGDVIVRFDGDDTHDVGQLRNRVARTAPGAHVKLEMLRAGKRETRDVKLGTLPGKAELARAATSQDSKLGFRVQELDDEMRARLGDKVQSGVVVTKVESGSKAAQAGLRAGMLIVEVNQQAIQNVEEFHQAIEAASQQQALLLLVRSDGSTRYLAFDWNG